MIIDGHVHIFGPPAYREEFLERLHSAGFNGAVLLSVPPEPFPLLSGYEMERTAEARLENLMAWCEGPEELIPVFWIHPEAGDALEQVGRAASAGVKGFKVICNSFFPGEEIPMKTFRAIAETGLPVMFHSGILWDGTASSQYNRPAGFEPLITIPKLRFSLAHISWPWNDECIAVYGKFLNGLGVNPKVSAEMFVDTTPGTPEIYREDALRKLYTIGYDVEHNVFFGSDGMAERYNSSWAKEWVERDGNILDKLGCSKTAKPRMFAENVLRFFKIVEKEVTYNTPAQGE